MSRHSPHFKLSWVFVDVRLEKMLVQLAVVVERRTAD